ncbi:MAG: sugar phosphate isomerase/epimerase [Actinomycetota bacterium]|nr:sugar phosphate isomerase/epimerase [Actinomycetota bacterium]
MRIALLTDALESWRQDEAFAWCAARGITALELGVGGYSPAPHVDLERLLASEPARAALTEGLDERGLEVVALNASGNPLHPDAAIARAHDRALRDALELAAALEIPRVVAMSGCPGGPGGGAWPVFAGGAWLPDMEGLFETQWLSAIEPYWRELSAWAADRAPGVDICLELHPGTSIYNLASFELLASVTHENVRVNLDPSHFWWQGIDPITTIRALGDRIGFVHGKDTLIHPDRVALHGVLDFRWPADADTMPWHFCAVGRGRPIAEWRRLIEALEAAGYGGPVSIEHEDPSLSPEAGIETSLEALRAATQAPAGHGGR